VDRPQQFAANTQSDAFFGDVYRSAQDDVLLTSSDADGQIFFVCNHDMVAAVEFVLSFFFSFFLSFSRAFV
jgi:hypothetical protein